MENTLQIIGAMMLAVIPAVLWGMLFYIKRPENKRLSILTFLMGGLVVFPILLYKVLWEYFPGIDATKFADQYRGDHIFVIIPLSVIITYMIFGVIEEIMKYSAVKLIDDHKLMTIDDAIEFFIIAALGFAFVENILYFYDSLVKEGPSHLFVTFLFRSGFSTFAHIMFSGILGYYYGIAHFATPILQEEIRANRHHWTKLLHKLLSIRKEKLFYQEKLTEGLLLATGLHAIFNIFLSMKWTFLTVPMLVAGYITLTYLFAKKNNHKRYGYLLEGSRNHPLNPHKNYFHFVKRFRTQRDLQN